MNGNAENFIVNTFVPVGEVQGLELKIESKHKSPKPLEMFIDKIVVVNPEQMTKHVFYIDKHFMAGGPTERFHQQTYDISNLGSLFWQHIKSLTTEEHLWASVIRRPQPSVWTRVERAGCLSCGLFLAVLANSAFFGKEYENAREGWILTNYLRISNYTLMMSIVATIIIILPTTVIATLFRNTARKSAERHSLVNIFNVKLRVGRKTVGDQVLTQKKLPILFVILAWILIVCCVTASIFYCVLISLNWNIEKSLEWVAAMIFHMIVDLLIIQMVKIILYSAVFTIALRFPQDGLGMFTPSQFKKQSLSYTSFQAYLIGLVHHVLLILSFLFLIFTTWNSEARIQQKMAASALAMGNREPLKVVSDYGEVFDWLRNDFMDSLKTLNHLRPGYSGTFNFLTPDEFYSIPNHELSFMSPLRLRQHRASPSACHLEKALVMGYSQKHIDALNIDAMECRDTVNEWSMTSSTERRSFDASWSKPLYNPLAQDLVENSLFANESHWMFRESIDDLYPGYHGVYSSGGFYIDLKVHSIADAQAKLSELASKRWLDDHTLVLFVDVVFAFVQSNTFIPVKIIFETLPSGGIVYHWRIHPLKLYQYIDGDSFILSLSQLFWCGLIVSYFIKLFVQLIRQKPKLFFSNLLNWVGLLLVLLAAIGIFCGCTRIVLMLQTVDAITDNIDEAFISYDRLVFFDILAHACCALSCFLAILLSIEFLMANQSVNLSLRVLKQLTVPILSFVAYFLLLTLAFATLAYLMFGSLVDSFSSFPRTVLALWRCLPRTHVELLGHDASNNSFGVTLICYAFAGTSLFFLFNLFRPIYMAVYHGFAKQHRRDDALLQKKLGKVDLQEVVSSNNCQRSGKDSVSKCKLVVDWDKEIYITFIFSSKFSWATGRFYGP